MFASGSGHPALAVLPGDMHCGEGPPGWRDSLSLRKGDQAQLESPGAQLPPWPQESPSGRLDWELGDMELIPPDHSQATGLPRNGSDCFERRGCLVMRNSEARSIGHCSETLRKGTQQGVQRLAQTASKVLSN